MTNQKINPDSWRKRYIRLLTRKREGWNAEKHERTEEQGLDLEAIADLIDAGYMRGRAVRDHENDVIRAETHGVTLAGKLFAEEQEGILRSKSLWGRIRSGAGLFIGWLSGIISAVIVWYMTK